MIYLLWALATIGWLFIIYKLSAFYRNVTEHYDFIKEQKKERPDRSNADKLWRLENKVEDIRIDVIGRLSYYPIPNKDCCSATESVKKVIGKK